MPSATFYIIDPDSQYAEHSQFEHYLLHLLHHFTRQGAKVYLNTTSKADALYWDEKLFQLPEKQFIAHHLVGEGPNYGTQLEIGFDSLTPLYNRNLIVNISNSETIFARERSQVIDFVSCVEKEKLTARTRYRLYREAGFDMHTVQIEKTD